VQKVTNNPGGVITSHIEAYHVGRGSGLLTHI
jgi:hypothetical protein